MFEFIKCQNCKYLCVKEFGDDRYKKFVCGKYGDTFLGFGTDRNVILKCRECNNATV